MSRVNNSSRVFVLGIDGGTYSVIDSVRSQGGLPNFERLVKNGATATLRSTIPAITIPSWPSMFTGCNPGKHGLYSFELLDKEYRPWFTAAQDLRVKTLWRLLSDEGKRVIAIDVPGTYPPEEVNGMIVSGYAPTTGSEFTYPRDFKTRLLEELVPGYVLEPTPADGYGTQAELEEYMTACHENLKQIIRLAKHLIQNEEFDLFFLVFNPIDRLQHTFWRFWDPSHPDYTPNEVLKEAIPEGYRMIDDFLGSLLKDPYLNIVVVSDHGSVRLQKMLQIEEFFGNHPEEPASTPGNGNLFANPAFSEFAPDGSLESFTFGVTGEGDFAVVREGEPSRIVVTLRTQSEDSFVDLRQEFFGLDPRKLYTFTTRVRGTTGSVVELVEIGQGFENRMIASLAQNGDIHDIGRDFTPSSRNITLGIRNSSFGSARPGTVSVFNVFLIEGRDPAESLEPLVTAYPFIYIPQERPNQIRGPSYEERREIVIRKLLSLRCTGFKAHRYFEWIARIVGWRPPLVLRVYKKESIYTGWAMDAAPDLVYVLNNRIGLEHKRMKKTSQGWSAGHHPDGIFFAAGHAFKGAGSGSLFSVMDVAPTVLHVLDCGVPKYMDGRALVEIMRKPYDKQVRYVDTKGEVEPRGPLKDEEGRAIEKRLRSLGYID